jgi:hypothetical protein
MKRRRFMQALAAAPAVPAVAQQIRPSSPAPAAPPSDGRTRPEPGAIDLTQPDAVADSTARFFAPAQFSALRKLSEALMPPMNGNPGAVECGAPEFLDFLIGVSPAERQELYRNGLDALNAQASAKFRKPFAQLNAKQVDAVLRPLLAATPWALDLPKDPAMRFIASARSDVATATRNSPAWAEAAGSGTRGGRRGQLKWLPIDPVYKG